MTETAAAPNRKAILSIDGGGIRGVLSLQVLMRLEKELGSLPGRTGTVLADHFDMIAGTSVGGIFAALIALRMPVSEVAELIRENAKVFFTPTGSRWRRFLYHRFEQRPLADLIKSTVGERTTLGDLSQETLLLLIMRNASTDSPWIISNCRDAPFNRISEQDGCNLHLPLWQLIRASAAAPYFFAPEIVRIGPREFVFVDGALTGFNNPAFKAFQYATTGSYGLRWPAGEQQLSIVSVGTGYLRKKNQQLEWARKSLLGIVQELPVIQISAADREQDVLCRTFGRCQVGDWIDYEVEDLRNTSTALEPRLFTYYRINVGLDAERLTAMGFKDVDPVDIARIDAVGNRDRLADIGGKLADEVFGRGLPIAAMGRSARPA